MVLIPVQDDRNRNGAGVRGKDTTLSTAPKPFDEGDVILRTADEVDFHVWRPVLSLASPFFKDMFSLRQTADGISVIPEDGIALTCLLRYCYPIHDPAIDDLELLTRDVEAAIKYDIEDATYLAKEVLLDLMQDNPLHAYAISCSLRCEEEAAAAAEIWKSTRESWVDDT